MVTKTVLPNGTQEWRNEEGQIHNDDGPAVIFADGTKYWFREDKLHNDDGPAIVYLNGDRYWYRKDELHNDNGPAVIFSDGTELWFRDGKRVDPPSN